MNIVKSYPIKEVASNPQEVIKSKKLRCSDLGATSGNKATFSPSDVVPSGLLSRSLSKDLSDKYGTGILRVKDPVINISLGALM